MSIELITGCMFSGKTTELIRLIRRARVAGLETVLYKYANDTRYDNVNLAASHDGMKELAIPIYSATEIKWTKGMVVGIDEGQFIKDLCPIVQQMADKGVTVIISALDSDYLRESFPTIATLWPKCDRRTQLLAICHDCKADACFSKRIVSSENIELIGGSESYKAVCRHCYK